MDVSVPGWQITVDDTTASLAYFSIDVKKHAPFTHTESFPTAGMTEYEIANRIFAVVQFVTDHELRERFQVDGRPFFAAHANTGAQREWFVEHQTAVRGY